MAPLSHDLTGIILPRNHFGDHMDSWEKPSMKIWKRRTFQKLGTGIWSKTVIDGKPVECKAVPLGNEHVTEDPDSELVSRHAQQAQYSHI